ncbi:unnamed protein product [Candida verbasci]|uniref:C2H2-type domain-containing protein n=1 Tax=Candida verbasci TaxID=1227364 RepID=A0A9W4TTZ3_9ASCO|nr:unnamed protein product [Candida verbasci]
MSIINHQNEFDEAKHVEELQNQLQNALQKEYQSYSSPSSELSPLSEFNSSLVSTNENQLTENEYDFWSGMNNDYSCASIEACHDQLLTEDESTPSDASTPLDQDQDIITKLLSYSIPSSNTTTAPSTAGGSEITKLSSILNPTTGPTFSSFSVQSSSATAPSIAGSEIKLSSTSKIKTTFGPVVLIGIDLKKNLLKRYTKNTITQIKLCDSDLYCDHCSIKFNDYLDLINHCNEFQLMNLLDKRWNKCPVKECPLHLIGSRKKADMRHHVHQHHVVMGLIPKKYKKYETDIKELLFVCDYCSKGFYRSDSLTRHVKLVHEKKKEKMVIN